MLLKIHEKNMTISYLSYSIVERHFHSNELLPHLAISIYLQKEDRASLEQFTHHDRRVEHMETSYDRTQEFSGETSIEEITGNTREITDNTRGITGNTNIEGITGNTRRTDSKKETRQDRTDRSRREEKSTEVKRHQTEERREKMERREEKKMVKQSSVKSLTEKYIKTASKLS